MLNALKELWISTKEQMQPYADEMICILLKLMENKAVKKKRKVALKTFIEVIKNNNYVVFPYLQHPVLL